MLDKTLIKFRFKKNLNTYDKSAVVQQRMAEVLTERICEFCGKKHKNIFEFGAGTGFLTGSLLHNLDFEQYCGNDILEESEDYVKRIIKKFNFDSNFQFLPGDIENLDIKEKYGLIVSNAVIQWIINTDELLSKMNESLEEGGYFAFTTFGEKNFSEIKDTTGLSLDYLKTETLRQKCETAFEVVFFEEDISTLYFDSPIEVLKHIKASGTNGLKSLSWTFSRLKNFEKYYRENFSENAKVKLTYNPIYIILKKK